MSIFVDIPVTKDPEWIARENEKNLRAAIGPLYDILEERVNAVDERTLSRVHEQG